VRGVSSRKLIVPYDDTGRSGIGSGRNGMRFTTLKMALFAQIPRRKGEKDRGVKQDSCGSIAERSAHP